MKYAMRLMFLCVSVLAFAGCPGISGVYPATQEQGGWIDLTGTNNPWSSSCSITIYPKDSPGSYFSVPCERCDDPNQAYCKLPDPMPFYLPPTTTYTIDIDHTTDNGPTVDLQVAHPQCHDFDADHYLNGDSALCAGLADCNDKEYLINPGAPEILDLDGIPRDNNCDGQLLLDAENQEIVGYGRNAFNQAGTNSYPLAAHLVSCDDVGDPVTEPCYCEVTNTSDDYLDPAPHTLRWCIQRFKFLPDWTNPDPAVPLDPAWRRVTFSPGLSSQIIALQPYRDSNDGNIMVPSNTFIDGRGSNITIKNYGFTVGYYDFDPICLLPDKELDLICGAAGEPLPCTGPDDASCGGYTPGYGFGVCLDLSDELGQYYCYTGSSEPSHNVVIKDITMRDGFCSIKPFYGSIHLPPVNLAPDPATNRCDEVYREVYPCSDTCEGLYQYYGTPYFCASYSECIDCHHCKEVEKIQFQDAIQFVGFSVKDPDRLAHDFWIDNCTLSNYPDELIDLYDTTRRITVSWNKFEHQVKPLLWGWCDCTSTNGTCIMPDSGTGHPDPNKIIEATMHHNYFNGWTFNAQRHPKINWGNLHAYNNYLDNWWLYGMWANQEAQIIAENNVFNFKHDPTDPNRLNGIKWEKEGFPAEDPSVECRDGYTRSLGNKTQNDADLSQASSPTPPTFIVDYDYSLNDIGAGSECADDDWACQNFLRYLLNFAGAGN